MPLTDPDPTDPMTLHAVELETTDGRVMCEMAACFIEELARLGFGPARILDAFRTGQYAGPAMALRTLGEPVVTGLIADEFRLRGRECEWQAEDWRSPSAIRLPVLH